MTHRTATFKAREFSVPPTGMGVSIIEDVETPVGGAEEAESTIEEATPETEEVTDVTDTDTEAPAEDSAEAEAEAEAEAVPDESEGEAPLTSDEVGAPEYPEGDPSSTWKVGEINAWAAARVPAVEFPEGATRLQKLALIKDLLQGGEQTNG